MLDQTQTVKICPLTCDRWPNKGSLSPGGILWGSWRPPLDSANYHPLPGPSDPVLGGGPAWWGVSLIPQPGSVLPRAAELLLSRAQASPPGAPGLSIEALWPGPAARSLQRPQRSSPEVTAGPSKGKLRPRKGHTPPDGVWAGAQRGAERAAATLERAGAVRRGGGTRGSFQDTLRAGPRPGKFSRFWTPSSERLGHLLGLQGPQGWRSPESAHSPA